MTARRRRSAASDQPRAGRTVSEQVTLPDEIRSQHAAAASALARSLLGRTWATTRSGQAVGLALSRLPAACAEIDRLGRLLAGMRRAYQDLAAAARASLAAEDDGEDDPFYYLRDELRAQGQADGYGEGPR